MIAPNIPRRLTIRIMVERYVTMDALGLGGNRTLMKLRVETEWI